MIKKYLNKTSTSVLFIMIIGFIFGIFSTNTIGKLELNVIKNNSSIVKTFINAFTLNYWYLFIIWFLAFIPLGFVIIYFITFFKSCLTGIIFGICLKASAIFGIYQFVGFSILEILILFPTLLYLSSKSINLNFEGKRRMLSNGEDYFNVLIKVTILIIIYAILSCIKMTILEVQ